MDVPSPAAGQSSGLLHCDACGAVIDPDLPNAWCPGCQAPLQVLVFPALFRASPEVRAQEAVQSQEEASCFSHPRKRAVVHCAQCGRFLCGLCDLEIGGRHLCPSCVGTDRARTGRVVGELENAHILYDRMALMLALWPVLLLWPLTVITSPAALYLAIRHWRDPARSLLPRTQTRLILAILLAGLQIVGWTVIFWLYCRRHFF